MGEGRKRRMGRGGMGQLKFGDERRRTGGSTGRGECK